MNKDIVEVLKKLGMPETKANEVMHSTNTGAGAEFIPSEVFASEIFSLVPKESRLLPLLPGSHGTKLPKTYTAPVIGLSIGDLEFEGKGEWTTGTSMETENDHSQKKATTKSVTLNQAGFICEVDISDEQLLYNAVNTETYVKERIRKGMAYTVDAAIINGDSEAGATGNVNLDDAAPSALKYYMRIDGGIRERAINSGYTVNAGTLAAADFVDVLSLLGRYATNPEDCLFITQNQTKMKVLTLDEFETVDKRGKDASIVKGMIETPYGVDMLVHHAVSLTEADGKVSTTAGNNTLGQLLAVYKPAIQYGFGQDLKLEVVRVPGYGYRVVATFQFAFTIVDSEASLTNPTVAAGINITV